MTDKATSPDRMIAPFELATASSVEDAEVQSLYDLVFGPGRFAKTAERLRERNQKIAEACYVATDEQGLVGSVQFWPLAIGEAEGVVLLGPLAIDPRRRGDGIAFKLMEAGIKVCADRGAHVVVLVGDEPYYARAGFKRAEAGRFTMPGPVNQSRLLVRELSPEGANLAGALSVPRATRPAS